MPEHDDTQERSHHVDLEWTPVEGGLAAAPPLAEQVEGHDDDAQHADVATTTGLAHPRRAVALTAVGALILVAGVAAVWFARTVTAPTRVPVLAGMSTAQASASLAEAGLNDGWAYYKATNAFPPGLILKQTPLGGRQVTQETSVNVQVVVASTASVMPDVVLAPSDTAQALLRRALFEPSVTYAYSKDVATGLVIEQLPRAGDTAMTGDDEFLVVSLGPGSGKAVPAVVGKKLSAGLAQLDAAALYARVRPVIDPSLPEGTIVDQAPQGGSIVPVQTGVTLSVAVPKAASPQPY